MNSTTNFSLNQWDATDRILHTDFNSDNQKLDAALKTLTDGSLFVPLRKIVTTADAQQVDVNISDIDWGKYPHVLVLPKAVGTYYSSGGLRLNSLCTGGDYYVRTSSGSIQADGTWGSFALSCNGVAYQSALLLTGGISYPQCDCWLWGTASISSSYCVKPGSPSSRTMNFLVGGGVIRAGMTITMYGVKL